MTGEILGTFDLTGSTQAPGEARQFVRKVLGDGCPRIDDVLLATSELVTNSVLHSHSRDGGLITVVLVETAGGVRVEVVDEGSPASTPRVGAPPRHGFHESGRGLWLIRNLSGGRWGHYAEDAGRTVWVDIVYDTPAAAVGGRHRPRSGSRSR